MSEESDGNSTAAWTGVTIMLIATAVGGWGVFAGPVELLYAGLIGFLVGGLAWYGLDRAGFGETQRRREEREDSSTR